MNNLGPDAPGGDNSEDRPSEGQLEYAGLAANTKVTAGGKERSVVHRVPLEERPALVPRAEEMLADARARLARVQSGEEPVKEGTKYEAWERAMADVEQRQGVLDALQSGEVDDRPIPVLHPRGDTDQSGHRRQRPAEESVPPEPSSHEPQDQRSQEGSAYISDPPKAYDHDGPDADVQYRAQANVAVAQMLEDPSYASELQSRKGFGRDRSEKGVGDIMAAYALPFLLRAQKAEARGLPERAQAYRQEASDAANLVARAIRAEGFVRASAAAGHNVLSPSGGGWATERASRRPRDMMRARSQLAKRGLSLKAVIKRS